MQIKLQNSRGLQHNNLETVTNEEENIGLDKERYIFPEERKKIVDDLRLI